MFRRSWLLVLGWSLLGCNTGFAPVAQHTIQVAPDRQSDVVWIIQGGDKLLRCSQTEEGPVCVAAQLR